MSTFLAYTAVAAKPDLVFAVVDPDDPSMDPSGTTKRITAETLLAGYVPTSQSLVLANNTFADILAVSVTGQTDDPLPPFGLKTGSQTYGTSPAVQGPAAWLGWNTDLLSAKVSSSAHGSVGMSFFADAGDTNVAGAHGLEANICFRSKGGTKIINPFQFIAPDDNSGTGNTVIRCGTGGDNGAGVSGSGIYFENADASTVFLILSHQGQNATFGVPVTVNGDLAVTGKLNLTNPLNDPLNLGFNANYLPGGCFPSAAASAAANIGYYSRLIAGGYSTSTLTISVTASSGNISLALYKNSGSGAAACAPTGGRYAASGAVPCPAVGLASVSLGSAVTPAVGDWAGLSCDNTTAQFIRAYSGQDTGWLYSAGWGMYQASAHPLPATPSGYAASGIIGTYLIRS